MEEINQRAKLNPQQELFCKYYATDREFFANGTHSYCHAYGLNPEDSKDYKTAMTAASRLLRNDKILDRINELLEDGGLNDQFVDKQLLFLAKQNDELPTKLNAIREYNKLKQRITDIRQVNVSFEDQLDNYDDKQRFPDDNQTESRESEETPGEQI